MLARIIAALGKVKKLRSADIRDPRRPEESVRLVRAAGV
jgi:hypothetical protein